MRITLDGELFELTPDLVRRRLGGESPGASRNTGWRQPAIDEERLTRWMHGHLRIVVVPVEDADSLDALETVILRELDPPVNLAKVPKNPVRRQLSALRREYAGAV